MSDKTFNQVDLKSEMISCHLFLYFTKDRQGLTSYVVKILLLSRWSILTITSNKVLHRQKETTHKTYKQDKICQRRKANVLSKEE